ncbi:MAG TPA: tyrosine-type recombinase/integrase [Pseudonocardiaceae bacterium]|nr:tyrosine-type recombinase/integrase [Pseudonocardiaceae bacterium]
MSSYEFRMWGIRKRDRQKPYQVRWLVAGRSHAETFVTRALAESFRAELMSAARAGEAFDEVTGLPECRGRDVPWFDHAVSYVDTKWPRAAAKSRKSIAEALTTVTIALLLPRRGRPDDAVIRRALFGWAFNAGRRAAGTPPVEVGEALAWVSGASRPVSSLRDLAVIRSVLDALTVRLDGKPAAATSVYRKRAVFYNALGLAVERRLLATNPIDQVQWTAPDVAESVDRRVVASPKQVRALLDTVHRQPRRGEYLMAFFGCLYYAGMRPAEVVALRAGDCELPASGWGRLQLARSEPWAGQEWTDNGEARDHRALKRRASNAVRTVPIPAELVSLLRTHLDTFGTGEAGRVFHNERGGPFNEASARRAWARARVSALTEEQVQSPLACRPYDLRHAAASLWLNNRVPATEVARRLGHDVAVLLKIYANCIDGQEDTINDQITAALAAGQDHETLPAATAVHHAAQPNLRTRRGPEPGR